MNWFDWLGEPALASNVARPVVLIHGQALQRDCLRRILTAEFPDQPVQVFASVADWKLAWRGRSPLPLVLLCDGNSVADTDLIALGGAQAASAVPVIQFAEAEDMASVLEALDRGVKGYIPYNSWIDVVIEATRLVIAGGVYIPAASLIKAKLEGVVQPALVPKAGSVSFTARQLAIIAALSKGKANAAIADELDLCESTVKVHVRNIMKKLKARSRTEIAYKSRDILAAARIDTGAPARGGPGSSKRAGP